MLKEKKFMKGEMGCRFIYGGSDFTGMLTKKAYDYPVNCEGSAGTKNR